GLPGVEVERPGERLAERRPELLGAKEHRLLSGRHGRGRGRAAGLGIWLLRHPATYSVGAGKLRRVRRSWPDPLSEGGPSVTFPGQVPPIPVGHRRWKAKVFRQDPNRALDRRLKRGATTSSPGAAMNFRRRRQEFERQLIGAVLRAG